MIIKHALTTLIVGMILLAVFAFSGLAINQPYNPHDEIKNTFIIEGYTVIVATTDSPAIEVNLKSQIELTQNAKAINSTTIYDTNRGFVVIDAIKDVGYFYNTTPELTWYGFHPAFLVVFLAVTIIILLEIVIKYEEQE